MKPAGPTERGSKAVEACRLLAVVLLVTYHVIGSGPAAGLQVTSGFARHASDFFADVRMPLFAFIAGFAYAAKPVSRDRLGGFLIGKFRRLALPGAVAISIFMGLSAITSSPFAPDKWWYMNYVTPYAHYWFLEAILLIFIFYCSFDVLTKGRFLLAALLLSVILSIYGPRLPTLMSANQAVYLLPYFIFGTIFGRYGTHIEKMSAFAIFMALIVMVAATAVSLIYFHQFGHFSGERRDLQSVALGFSVAALAYFIMPRLPLPEKFGAYAFSIYLYHVLGSSGARRLLHYLGVENFEAHLAFGVLAAVFMPIALHKAAETLPLTRLLFTGQDSGARQVKPAAAN